VHEKRAHSRLPLKLEVTCKTEGGATIPGQTRDISVGGAYIESPEVPAFGTKVSVELHSPGANGMLLPGIVRWTKPDGFGVQFQLLGARETHLLAELLRR